eukprot:227066_1
MHSVNQKYAKVINKNDHIEDDSNQTCNNCLYNWIESQTTIPSLILYAYLYWYLLIQFAFGIQYMSAIAWLSAAVLATFVWVLLNAAAYHAPACGQKGYFKNYFKVLKFWLIPFCVSSISVACNLAPHECKLLFPTDTMLLIYHLCGMLGIMCIGSIIHYLILPKVKCNDTNGDGVRSYSEIEIKIDNVSNGGTKN